MPSIMPSQRAHGPQRPSARQPSRGAGAPATDVPIPLEVVRLRELREAGGEPLLRAILKAHAPAHPPVRTYCNALLEALRDQLRLQTS